MSEYVLDADPLVPTGVPATSQQVAAMVVDPESPLTIDMVPRLTGSQQPTVEEITAAVTASPVVAVKGEDVTRVVSTLIGDVPLRATSDIEA